MTIDEAMYGAENPITLSYSRAETALFVLAAEVRRLRAAVEAVKELPRLMQEEDCMRVSERGYYVDRAYVLRILEGE